MPSIDNSEIQQKPTSAFARNVGEVISELNNSNRSTNEIYEKIEQVRSTNQREIFSSEVKLHGTFHYSCADQCNTKHEESFDTREGGAPLVISHLYEIDLREPEHYENVNAEDSLEASTADKGLEVMVVVASSNYDLCESPLVGYVQAGSIEMIDD